MALLSRQSFAALQMHKTARPSLYANVHVTPTPGARTLMSNVLIM